MKVEIEYAPFHELINRAAKALASRPASPVLAGLSLRAEEGALHACAFDFEFAVRASASATVGEPGSVLVSGRLLADIVRALPKLPVTLTTDGARMLLVCGTYSYTLTSMPLKEYPSLPETPGTIGSVHAAALVSAAGQTALAADRDETLPFLTGVRLEFGPESLRLVSTDRYRLAVRDLPWHPSDPQSSDPRISEPQPSEPPAAGSAEAAALVPARTLLDAARLFEPDQQIGLGLGDGLLGLISPGLEVTLRQLDGSFIRYAQLFPEHPAGRAVVEVAPLLEAIKAVALVAERNTPVRLEFATGQVAVVAGSGDQALARATIEAIYDADEPVVIAVNPAYLIDGLGCLGTPYAQLTYPEKVRPVVLTGVAAPDGEAGGEAGGEPDAQFRYLFIPVRASTQS
ncbi:DNA polymerase III subunit beta [Actinospica sp. MGRD01-02]|uniref:DNA polymerase III subunit beta n=1 Tax=Actinospica acidithermotolerans TaxID=2828514 RepID=A0A941E937_9ACTN|nr:DNA polymerase III subunit beta [Actinospica acidithermotolerans]MBR7824829.1 DNA polymerase III subunit beta [Actinospica acidithermotolerans]